MGEELVAEKFSILGYTKTSTRPDKMNQGNQAEGGKFWCALAHTKLGKIPGKAQNRICYYSINGEPHFTKEFSYVLGNHLVAMIEIERPSSVESILPEPDEPESMAEIVVPAFPNRSDVTFDSNHLDLPL